jgi:hypothetical protein
LIERSRFRGGVRIGLDYFERRRAIAGVARGLVDDVADLGLDASAIAPAVRAFFDETASLELYIESAWRFPFSLGWRALRPLMRAIGQFVLPRRTAWIATDAHALDAKLDGRAKPRAIVRSYVDGGGVFQVVAYSTWKSMMSAAFPLPGGQLAGLLRAIATERRGVLLTSDGEGAGVWFVLGPVAMKAPLGERLELWPVDEACDDADRIERATIRGRHEQRVFGVVFAVHDYWFRPSSASCASTENENATRGT